MKTTLKAFDGDEYSTDLPGNQANSGVIEMDHRLFVYSHVSGGVA